MLFTKSNHRAQFVDLSGSCLKRSLQSAVKSYNLNIHNLIITEQTSSVDDNVIWLKAPELKSFFFPFFEMNEYTDDKNVSTQLRKKNKNNLTEQNKDCHPHSLPTQKVGICRKKWFFKGFISGIHSFFSPCLISLCWLVCRLWAGLSPKRDMDLTRPSW